MGERMRQQCDFRRCASFGLFLLPVLLAVALVGLPVRAQIPAAPNLSPEALQQMQQQMQQQGGQRLVPSTDQQTPVVLQPENATARQTSPLSRLEQIMSARTGVQLRQFGYDQFGFGRSATLPQAGAVQDDYILGAGDEIVVSLRGTENNELRALVDRNGQVVLSRLNPISAAGRRLDAFRNDVEAAVGRAFVATNAFVSVSRVRQINVLVSGEVNVPGQRIVTGLASVLEAILLSGGVRKSGSLRSIRVQRGGREFVVDLYGVLTDRGASSNIRLADGDRIRVPLLGPTVAITGLVRQPGIYELPSGQRSISVPNLVSLAGGEEVRGRYRLSVLRVEADGRMRLAALPGQAGSVGDSEILFVEPAADQTVSRAILSGDVGLAGSYPITEGTKLSEILRSPGALGNSPYTLFGMIARRDPRTLMRSLTAFTPVAVLNGTEDLALQTDDIVRVLSMEEMRVSIAAMQNYEATDLRQQESLRNPVDSIDFQQSAAQQPGENKAPNNLGGIAGALLSNSAGGPQLTPSSRQSLDFLPDGQPAPPASVTHPQPGNPSSMPNPPAVPPAADFQQRFVAPGGYAINREARTLGDIAQQLGVDSLVLINFLMDHRVTLSGAVRGPGLYLAGPSVLLSDLVTGAGGAVNWVDGSRVELISTTVDFASGRSVTSRTDLPLTQNLFATYLVKPRDEIRFNALFTNANVGKVTVQGEVRFVGQYTLMRGDRLSDLLARAGGLTNTAYPYGTVFLRKSVAAIERAGYQRVAGEIQEQLVAGMTRAGTNRIEPATFASMQSFVAELRNQTPLGRISIVADPVVLASRRELDPLLEPDDVIYIPPRPSTITVLGQVMQPGNFAYRTGETVRDYIARAGGYGPFADENQTFIVLPDGTARKVERSWLRFDVSELPPGSAIVVPRDLMPFDLRQTLIDVSQILSQFAVAVASLAVISNNN